MAGTAVITKFKEFTALNYANQAQAVLNAFWQDVFKTEAERENVWQWVVLFVELDQKDKAEGRDLDEFNAHRFLEKVGETKRVVELREQLKAIDYDFNKRVSLVEYVLFRYNKTVKDFVDRPQGDNSAEIAKANAMLEAVQKALDEASQAATASATAADAARKRSDESAAAEAEVRAALADVESQQQARDSKTETLKKI